jgi:predicted permease
VNPGFDQTVLEASLDTSLAGENGVALGNRLLERIASVTGVEAASFSEFGFGQGSGRICCFSPEGYTPHPDEDRNMRIQTVSAEYFRALGIAVLAGRAFSSRDRNGASQTAIINETTARQYFRGVDPIGKHFAWWPTDPKNIEIVGVVRDAKYDNLKQPTPRLVYLSGQQNGPGPQFVQIRARGARSASAVLADCRSAIRGVNSNIRVVSFGPISAAVNRTLSPERLVSSVSTGFGVMALLLTSVGLYGILAYGVARRTPEFGIRVALGAAPGAIRRMVIAEGLFLVGIGLAAGIPGAIALSRLIARLLFGVQPLDWVTFATAAAILVAVAAAASYGPARRATAVEPVSALRYE